MSQRLPSIYYGPSEVAGRGVFTYQDIPEGALLEICPVIVVPKSQFQQIHTSVLHDYYFLWGEAEEQCAIALGFGSLYNHSHEPNAFYLVDYEEQYIQFFAKKNIEAGAEIFVTYNGDAREQHQVWFENKD